MTLEPVCLKHFLPYIQQLPDPNQLEKNDVMGSNFLMKRSGNLEMFYAPHNEYINQHAKIVIVGITPGWTQMKTAFQQAKTGVQQRDSDEELMKRCKRAAGFAGIMRKNLIEMLDACGVNAALQLGSCNQLFDQYHHLLHTTSVIKYPVFIKGKNYTGYIPKIEQSPILKKYAYQVFPEGIEKIKNDYLLVPLGKVVTEVINKLVDQGRVAERRCLFGFPHPSGANGHRKKQFEKEKSSLQFIVNQYSD